MQPLPPSQQHHYFSAPSDGWVVREPFHLRHKRALRLVILIAAALAIIVITFASVAGYYALTSQPAKLVAKAAVDKAHSAALDLSEKADCERQAAEAKARGDYAPPCVKRYGLESGGGSATEGATAVLKAIAAEAID